MADCCRGLVKGGGRKKGGPESGGLLFLRFLQTGRLRPRQPRIVAVVTVGALLTIEVFGCAPVGPVKSGFAVAGIAGIFFMGRAVGEGTGPRGCDELDGIFYRSARGLIFKGDRSLDQFP